MVFADGGHNGTGGGRADATGLHELPGLGIFIG